MEITFTMDTVALLRLLFIFNLSFRYHTGEIVNVDVNNTSKPLILTSYLYSVNTNITDIRLMSEVGPIQGLNDYTTYSGFFTVDAKYNSNIFFWFMPTPLQSETNAYPLVVWLTSGNGVSGIISALGEIGPFQLAPDGVSVEPRMYNWGSAANLLFIDAPVGTGFSYTEDDAGYARNATDVATQLFTALMQFFKVFPTFITNDLYLAAESFSVRYTATLSYRIYYENPYLECPLNLKGVINISPQMDYRYMINISSQLYDLGLLNEAERQIYAKAEVTVNQLVNNGAYGLSMSAFSSLVLGDLWPTMTTFQTLTGLTSYQNIQQPYNNYSFPDVVSFINSSNVRQALHVANVAFGDASVVIKQDYNDVMRSYTAWLEDMLNKGFRWLMVIGQFGLLVNPDNFNQYINDLNWKSTDEYFYAERILWMTNTSEVTAYITPVNNLILATVLSAGQVVPADQPQVMTELVEKFLSGKTFN